MKAGLLNLLMKKLSDELEKVSQNFSSLEKEVSEFNGQVVQGKIEKLVGVFKISALQTEAKKYEEVITNTAKLAFPEQQLRTQAFLGFFDNL